MTPVLQAVLAAVAFGLSPPLAKLLLESVSPVILAGLLYAGAGLVLTAVRPGRWRRARALPRSEWLLLTGAVGAGGVAAPPLLFWGLTRGPASSTALLLNLEVVFTALLAALVFREHLGGRVAAAAALVAAGGVVLGEQRASLEPSLPALAVAGACALWALDNNLTRRLAERDPVFPAQVKGIVAGAVNLALGAALGHPAPGWRALLLSLALGAISYGSSLLLFLLAMRALGAARAAGYFALAPFFAAVIGAVLFREPVGPRLLAAAALMAAGVSLLARERHVHPHRHLAAGAHGARPLDHSHPHAPDPEHRHLHR